MSETWEFSVYLTHLTSMSYGFIVGINVSYSIGRGRMPLKLPQIDFTGGATQFFEIYDLFLNTTPYSLLPYG
jgi:hypothetical protein